MESPPPDDKFHLKVFGSLGSFLEMEGALSNIQLTLAIAFCSELFSAREY